MMRTRALLPILFGFLLVNVLQMRQAVQAQDLYDVSRIQRIDITFNQSNWDYMLDTAIAGSEGYIMAAAVSINGTRFDSVGVKYKGNSSYNANNRKNPWHIELDHYKNQSYQGYSDLKLSNIFRDPSHIREVLGYEIVGKYMAAPRANFARVYVNGAYLGLYTNVEHTGRKFVDKHFYSKDNAFFKCTPVGGAGPGNTARPSLQYLGTDSALYANAYEPENPGGWAPLIRMMDTLNNKSSAILNVLDVDRALWMHVMNNVMVNLDSYLGTFGQNYYLYQDDNWRFNPFMWDLNMCFGGFPNTLSGPLSATQMQQLAPNYGDALTARPLIQKLLANARFKRMYFAHMRTLVAQEFANNSYYTRAQQLQTLIDSSVNADPNKFYTYQQFRTGLTTTIGTGPGGGVVGVQQLMSSRATFLTNHALLTTNGVPAISNVAPNPQNPLYNDSATIRARVTNATFVMVGIRDAHPKKFTYLPMYDDGRHDDGAAADGVYGVRIKVTATNMDYYVYADNNSTGSFYPANAEYEFLNLQTAAPVTNAGDLVISEFLAQNNNDTTDAAGQHEDWIELHNTTNAPISLAGLYLTDDRANLTKSALDPDVTIPAGGYLLVFADSDTASGEVHADFKLSAGGERIYLSTIAGQVLDSVIFGPQTADVSWSLCAGSGGGNSWVSTTNTTPGRGNDCPTTSLDELTTFGKTSFYPNPTTGQLFSNLPKPTAVRVFNLMGQQVLAGEISADQSLDMSGLRAGIYIVRYEGGWAKVVRE